MRITRCAFAALVCATLALFAPCASAEAGDAKRSTILVKAISFDLDLDERIGDALVVGVVYRAGDAGSRAVADSWVAAFMQLGALRIKNAPVRAIALPFDAAAIADAVKKDGVDALLACDGLDADLESLTQIAMTHRLMTIGAKRAFVERGLVLGVFYDGDKPRIIVNLTAARAGGFRFSSAMLRLAVLVK